MSKFESLKQKYSPKTFAGILGQPVAIQLLQRMITTNQLPSAITLIGPYGTGKTSIARVFAASRNCNNKTAGIEPCGKCPACDDIFTLAGLLTATGGYMEIEASRLNDTDIESIRGLAGMSGVDQPVIFVDESHLIPWRFQAKLLKTLEEANTNATFVFATTEPDRMLETVLSRSIVIELKTLPSADIYSLIEKIKDHEGILISPEAMEEIVRHADGHARDAIQHLDKLRIYYIVPNMPNIRPIDLTMAKEVLGDAKTDLCAHLLISLDKNGSIGHHLKKIYDNVNHHRVPKLIVKLLSESLLLRENPDTDPAVLQNHSLVKMTTETIYQFCEYFAIPDFMNIVSADQMYLFLAHLKNAIHRGTRKSP